MFIRERFGRGQTRTLASFKKLLYSFLKASFFESGFWSNAYDHMHVVILKFRPLETDDKRFPPLVRVRRRPGAIVFLFFQVLHEKSFGNRGAGFSSGNSILYNDCRRVIDIFIFPKTNKPGILMTFSL